MFEVMFSSRRNNSAYKKKIKELFPSVVGWIDDYKKAHGDNQFSIMLQRIESDLFIDNILKRVKKLKYFCLTKHDSLIIKRSDYEAILAIVKEEFSKIGLEYTLKITNLYGVNEEHKISWNQQTQIEEEEVREVDVVDTNVNILELTAIEISAIGYSDIEFRTRYGHLVFVPLVYEKYWSNIKSKLGITNRLSRESNQLGFDIELRRAIQNMVESESII